MPDRHVRPVRSGDRDEWIRLRAALYSDGALDDHPREVDEFLARPRMHPLLAEALVIAGGRGLLGFVELSLRPYAEGCASSPVAYVEGWYVDDSVRGQGWGRRLIEAAEAWARGQGCSELASDARIDNDGSHAAHRALGFEEVERIVCYRKGLPRPSGRAAP